MKVAVCICTFMRTRKLKMLLEGIDKLAFKKCHTPEVEIIVIDNDPKGSARESCEHFASQARWPLKYCVEPQQGISYARNRSVGQVAEDAQFVAFIDDDEVPHESWLDELLHTQSRYNADVVEGRVIPNFPQSVPVWVAKGGFFNQISYPSGHPLRFAATNNVLVRTAVFREMSRIFDERFAISGGEDTEFFMRVHRAGYKMVASADALVWECVPRSRANMKWILLRAYRNGSVLSVAKLSLDPSPIVIAERLLKGIGRITEGISLILPSLFTGRHVFVRALQCIFRGAGIIVGLLGVQYPEYRDRRKSRCTESFD